MGDDGKTVYVPVCDGVMDLKRIIASLHEEQRVNRFINIGPAYSLREADYKTLGTDDIETLDSIELDPMLSWFWRSVRQSFSLAQ